MLAAVFVPALMKRIHGRAVRHGQLGEQLKYLPVFLSKSWVQSTCLASLLFFSRRPQALLQSGDHAPDSVRALFK